MILSPSVARSPPKVAPSGKPVRRRENSPFGGMNRTFAGTLIEAERSKSEKSTSTAPTMSSGKKLRPSRRKIERQPGDMKALKMQRALSKVSYGQRSAVKSRISDIDSFREFPLLQIIQDTIPTEALRGMVDITPTPIQRLAIPALLGVQEKGRRRSLGTGTENSTMEQFLLAAETGSGKTLAYALPTIDAIKRAEAADDEVEEREKAIKLEKKKTSLFELEPPPLSSEIHSTSGRPRAIVLLPTSELVTQVGAIFKTFSHTVKLRVSLLSAAYSSTVIRNRLFGPGGIDVLVATPHLLSSIAQSDPNILSRVTHLIIDEADSLLDRSFAPLTSGIIDRATPSLKQLILCSATIPRSLDAYLQKRFPDLVRLATPNLHAIPRRVQLSVVDIDREPYRGNRDLACADAIWSVGRDAVDQNDTVADVKHIVVFVNEREKAPELAAYLVGKGIDAVGLNRDTTEQRRSHILSAFTSSSEDPVAITPTEPATEDTSARRGRFVAQQQRTLANVKVLVMTDIGARGIDTIAVRTVVLYDVPYTSIDFIHRLGRTGRMGRRGKGLVLVGKDDRKDVVREIREGMFRGQALI